MLYVRRETTPMNKQTIHLLTTHYTKVDRTEYFVVACQTPTYQMF